MNDFFAKNKKFFLVAGLCGAVFLAAAAYCVFGREGVRSPDRGNENNSKNYSENRYGFLIEYPKEWAFDAAYDRYAAGIMDADLNNKKCFSRPGVCGPECIDLRILISQKPADGQNAGLSGQLFNQMETIVNSNNRDLVEAVDVAGKKIYKVLSDAPTLSLTDACPGPLYLYKTDSGKFIYLFAGFGSQVYQAGEEEIKQIFSSINFK